jgi:bacteriocin-like protein
MPKSKDKKPPKRAPESKKSPSSSKKDKKELSESELEQVSGGAGFGVTSPVNVGGVQEKWVAAIKWI